MTDTSLQSCIQTLLHPQKLWTRSELLSRPCPLPKKPGVYAWYFRNLERFVPTDDCQGIGEFKLLYLGIAPVRPSSKSFLQKRILGHLRRRADSSTVRLSLGVVLSAELQMRAKPRGAKKVHFGEDESKLSRWMDENATVVWHEAEDPWLVEHVLIERLLPPLNLDCNARHPFYGKLHAGRVKLLHEVQKTSQST